MWSTNKSGKKEPLSLKQKKSAEKKKAAVELKKRREEAELQKAREKADKGGFKVLSAKNESQLERKNVDEKEIRKFLKSQLNRTDSEQAEEQALFTQGKITAERKAFFKQLANIPDNIQKDLITGYLSQDTIKADAYMKQWLKDANAYRKYLSYLEDGGKEELASSKKRLASAQAKLEKAGTSDKDSNQAQKTLISKLKKQIAQAKASEQKRLPPVLDTEHAGSATYGTFLYKGGDADDERVKKQEKLVEAKAALQKKAKSKAEKAAVKDKLFGLDTDDDTDDDVDYDAFAADLEAQLEEEDANTSPIALVGNAVERMLKENNITDPDNIEIKIRDSKGKITKGVTSLPKRWLEDEANKTRYGLAKADFSDDHIVAPEPWAVKRAQRADKEDAMYAQIWNLSAQIQAAWAKLEDLDAPSADILELRNELKSLYHKQSGDAPTKLEDLDSGNTAAWEGVGWYAGGKGTGPDSKRAKEIETELRALHSDKEHRLRGTEKDTEIKDLVKTIESMQADLRLLKMEAPKTIRQYQEVARCGTVYRQAPWLHAKVKRVYLSPFGPSLGTYKYIVVHTSGESKTKTMGPTSDGKELYYADNNTPELESEDLKKAWLPQPIIKDGRTWYAARNGFFELLCTAKGKTQEGNVLTIPLPPDIVKRYGIDEEHPKLSVIVGYETNRGFFVQDEKMYKSEADFFADKKKDLRTKIKELSKEPVNLNSRIFGAAILSNALESTSKSKDDDKDELLEELPEFAYHASLKSTGRVTRKGATKPAWYGATGDYVKKAILSIAFKGEDPVSLETFARKLGEVVVYIGPEGSKVFEERLRNRYYVDPQMLMDLTEADKFPEIFSEAAGTSEKILGWYRNEYAGKVDHFIDEFLRSVYTQESGEKLVSASVPTWDRTKTCQNVPYIQSKIAYTSYGDNAQTGNKLQMTKLADKERRKIQNADPRDLIHYMEDGVVFCFTVPELKKLIDKADSTADEENIARGKDSTKSVSPAYNNPISHEPFTKDFIERFKEIYMGEGFKVKRPDQLEAELDENKVREPDLAIILAPGLIDKIWAGLNKIKNPAPESDSDDDEVAISRTRGGGSSDGDSDSEVEPDADTTDYDGKCRHCKGELDPGSKGIRTLSRKAGAAKDATGSDAFHKREFCCRYCCEDCEEWEKKKSKN